MKTHTPRFRFPAKNHATIRAKHCSVVFGHRKNGFALIVTLSLMMLLMIIALGLLSLSAIELRRSQHSDAKVTAQTNARLALMLAIGDIQKNLGPDTRVSASAALVGDTNQQWLGAWKTRPDEDPEKTAGKDHHVIDYHENAAYLSDSRSGSNKPAAEAWLVSRPGAINPGVPVSGDETITLLKTDDAATTVTVPSIRLYGSQARIAYWVGDQSQKAVVSQVDPYASNLASTAAAPKEAFYGLLGAQAPYLDNFESATGKKSFEGLSASNLRSRIVTLGSSALLPLGSPPTPEVLRNHFHDFASSSLGLYTNVQSGGLKNDLTAYLEGGDVQAEAALKLPQLTSQTPIIPTANHLQTSPRFGAFKEWKNLADKVTGSPPTEAIEVQSPSVKHMSLGDPYPSGKERDITNVTLPAIQPIVVEASLGWDWSPYLAGTDIDGNPIEKLRAHIIPRLILWNPFNVTLKASRYAVALRTPSFGAFSYRNNTRLPGGRLYFDLHANIPNGRPAAGMMGFVTEETEIAPGECLIFTPDVENSLGTKLYGKAARMDTGNYTRNVLTAKQAPGVENFYVDTTIVLDTKETPENKYSAYGYSSNSNDWYCFPYGSNLFVVSQIPGNVPTNLDWNTFKTFPRIFQFIADNSGLSSYHKWYDAQSSLHPSNGGGYFREFKEGAPDIGPLDNRRAPRLWRRGTRMVWYNDAAEAKALPGYSPSRVSVPLVASTNLHGGMIYHNNWLERGLNSDLMVTSYSSHIYFRQPPNPSDYRSNYPPSPINDSAFGFPERVCLYDVPRKKTGILSLAQFQHAQLSYLPWHPSYIVGHSLSTHAADREHTALAADALRTDRWQTTDMGWLTPNFTPFIQNSQELLIYDIAYEVNYRVWDDYFLSTTPYRNGKLSWDGKTTLPYAPCASLNNGQDINSAFLEPAKANHSYAYHHAAAHLGNVGAFNVNSVSVHAWKAMLSSLNGKIRPSLDGGDNAEDYAFSRFVLPLKAGSSSIGDIADEEAQAGFRKLTEKEIDDLAKNIVLEVKKRGPFLSLSDFINRRLQPAPSSKVSAADDYTDPSRMGTLQAAIEAAGINSNLRDDDGNPQTFDDDVTLNDVSKVPSHESRPAFKSYDFPGYLMQNDLLTTLAPRITARGDTFVVRAYGEARGAKGDITAKAWCEATVQRLPEYIDPTNDAATPPRTLDNSGQWLINSDLHPLNRKFGRRFVVTGFRWLSADEVG